MKYKDGTKTFDTLQHGDMLIADYGAIGKDEYEVIEVFEHSVMLQKRDAYSTYNPCFRTIADLKRSPKIWAIKGYEPEVTLTIDEIADRFDIDPKRLRIKKGGA